MNTPLPAPADDEKRKSPARQAERTISSSELFAAGDEVVIAHEGEYYRLRRTRNGKLILTK